MKSQEIKLKSVKKLYYIICLVMLLTGIVIFMAGFTMSGYRFPGYQEEITYKTDELTAGDIAGLALNLTNYQADTVTIQAGDSDKITVTYPEKYVTCSLDSNQILTIKDLKVKHNTVNYQGFQVGNWEYTPTSVTIELPARFTGKLEAELTDLRFDVSGFTSLESLSVTNNYGPVTLNHIAVKNSLSVTALDGQIVMADCDAKQQLTVDNSYAGTSLKNITAENLTINGNDSEITISDCRINTSVSVAAKYRDLMITNLEAGTLSTDMNDGTVSLTDSSISKRINIQAKYGPVICKQIQTENLTIDNDDGEITLANCTLLESLDARSHYGSIHLDYVDAPLLTLNAVDGSVNGSLIGSADDYRIAVDCYDGSSNIYTKHEGERDLTVKTTYGNIDLTFLD